MGLKNTEKYVSEEMSLAELVKSKVIPWRLKAQKSTQREEVERSMRVCKEHLSISLLKTAVTCSIPWGWEGLFFFSISNNIFGRREGIEDKKSK